MLINDQIDRISIRERLSEFSQKNAIRFMIRMPAIFRSLYFHSIATSSVLLIYSMIKKHQTSTASMIPKCQGQIWRLASFPFSSTLSRGCRTKVQIRADAATAAINPAKRISPERISIFTLPIRALRCVIRKMNTQIQ